MKPSHSIWIRVVAPSPANWRVLLLKLDAVQQKKAKDQIENLNLYLDSELLQSLLACIFTSRYHQAGLSMLVLMNYSKPLCDMYRGIMRLCSMLTCWGGQCTESSFPGWYWDELAEGFGHGPSYLKTSVSATGVLVQPCKTLAFITCCAASAWQKSQVAAAPWNIGILVWVWFAFFPRFGWKQELPVRGSSCWHYSPVLEMPSE